MNKANKMGKVLVLVAGHLELQVSIADLEQCLVIKAEG